MAAAQVRDLWNPSSGNLSIREYPPGYWRGFYVEDLYIFECTDYDDMMFMLWEGMRKRAVGSHNLNKDSSRSHSMLTFYLESEEEVDGDPYVKFGKISFVDLAGSERLKETQSGEHDADFRSTFKGRRSMKGDEMLKETGQINKSLFTLGKVISALGDAKSAHSVSSAHIPYRDSKLTKLLMDSLGGSSKALMFACCSPASSYLEETLNTLQYAMRTRNIKNTPAVQVDPHEELVRELRAEMKLAKQDNQTLRQLMEDVAATPGCPDEIAAIIDEALDAELPANLPEHDIDEEEGARGGGQPAAGEEEDAYVDYRSHQSHGRAGGRAERDDQARRRLGDADWQHDWEHGAEPQHREAVGGSAGRGSGGGGGGQWEPPPQHEVTGGGGRAAGEEELWAQQLLEGSYNHEPRQAERQRGGGGGGRRHHDSGAKGGAGRRGDRGNGARSAAASGRSSRAGGAVAAPDHRTISRRRQAAVEREREGGGGRGGGRR
eukprot:COSAG01_NODE_4474_length_4989_cov_2.852147_1_plen_490_part_10